LIRFFSNQSIGLLLANSLTLVGWIRVSIGPAISVSVAGRAGWFSSDITAAAASAETDGWQIATMCAREPIWSRKVMRWSV
jgi:hypothetical protein